MKIERTVEKDRAPLRRSFNDCTFSDMLQNRESSKRIDKGLDAPLKDGNERGDKRKSIDRLKRELLFREGVLNSDDTKEDSLKDEIENSLNDDGAGNFFTQENNNLPESHSKSSSTEELLNLAADRIKDITTEETEISAKDELRYEDNEDEIESKDEESEIKFVFGLGETTNENDNSISKIDDKLNIDMKINNEDDGAFTVEEYENMEESEEVISLEYRNMNEILDTKSI